MTVAGQAFFITNGEPIPFWDFPRAVWAEYNGHVPKFVVPLPVSIGLAFASIGEGIGYVTGKTPNLTRGKIVYSTVNRYYNIEKVSFLAIRYVVLQSAECLRFQARRILGYEPVIGLQEGIKRAVAWYKENERNSASAAQ